MIPAICILHRDISFRLRQKQGVTDLPEHAHLRGVKGGYTPAEGDETLDQRARGIGGVKSSCGEENLLDLDTDPRYGGVAPPTPPYPALPLPYPPLPPTTPLYPTLSHSTPPNLDTDPRYAGVATDLSSSQVDALRS